MPIGIEVYCQNCGWAGREAELRLTKANPFGQCPICDSINIMDNGQYEPDDAEIMEEYDAEPDIDEDTG